MSSNQLELKIDFSKVSGIYKPMHGVGEPPRTGLTNSMFHYLGRAGIPYSRLHDVGGWMGGGLYVDVPNLFRDFDADENDPANYDFAFTDKLLEGLWENGCEPYFRLGVSIENEHLRRAYRIFPPKDYEKWARICEHIIRHYIDGWADGYHWHMTYWEIWNEPDDCYNEAFSAMWKGTPEDFYRLYSTTAKHLKACFGDRIKVGGYGHCGVYEYAQDKELCGIGHEDTYIYDFTISFHHGFFRYIKETGAPLDFFSWHVYDNCHRSTREDFTVIREHADYCRRLLDHYGLTNAEHHLNEWNLKTDKYHRDAPVSAARTLGFMLMMQNTSTDVMCYYDASLGFSDYHSLFNPDKGIPYRTYYSFMMFNTLYTLKNVVDCEINATHVFAGAAVNASRKKAAIVLANTTDAAVSVRLDVSGFPMDEIQVLRIDEENRYTLTGETLSGGVVTIPACGCVEIKLWRL